MLEDRGSREGLLCITSEELRSVKRASSITEVYSVEDTVFARGKFATVRRASHKTTGVQYAAKYIKKRRRAIDMTPEIYHEICVLLNCASSSRVVRLHEVYETNADVVLVLELAAGGELQRIFDSDHCLTEVEARRAMRQILEGLSYLHEKNIAHLDLKPQNLLLTVEDCCDDIKLCDFGVSRLLEPGTEVRALLGTPDYVAPEVLSYEPISLSTDIWSAGVLAYVLLSGYTPFGAETKQQTYLNISQCVLTFEPDHFGDVSSAAIDFIKSALVVNPRNRPTVQELLQHHWISPKSHILPPLTLKTTSEVITTTPKTTPLSQHTDSSLEDSDLSLEKDVDEHVVYHLDTKYVSKMVSLFNNNCVNIIAASSIDIRVDEIRTVTDTGNNIENKLDEAPDNIYVDIVDEHTADKSLNNNIENAKDEHNLFENESRVDEAPIVIEAEIADQSLTDKKMNCNDENTEEEKSHEVVDNKSAAIENVGLDEALNTIDSLVDNNSVDEVLNNDLKHGNNTHEVLTNNSITIENITSTDETPTNIEANIVDEAITLLNNNDEIKEEENKTQEVLNTEVVVSTEKDDDETPTVIEADVVDEAHYEALNAIAISTVDIHTVNEVLDKHNSDYIEDEIKIDDVLCNNDIANINKIDEAPTNIEADVVNQHTADKVLMDNDTNTEDEDKSQDEALNTIAISTVDIHTVNEGLENNGDNTENEIKINEALDNTAIDNVNGIDEAPTNIEADVADQHPSDKGLMDNDANTEDENRLHDEALNSAVDIHTGNEVLDNVNDDTENEIKVDEVLGNNAIDINRLDETPTNIEADKLDKPDNLLNNKDQNTNIQNKTHVLSTNGIDIEKENRIDEAQELIYV